MTLKLNLVVAMSTNRGIGLDGNLPWKLRGDMSFFKRITSNTGRPDVKNAVIMGRKTWESIPKKFRPLPDRINIVISTSLSELPSGVHLSRSFDDAINMVQSSNLQDRIEQVFVIGGASVYGSALRSTFCHRIYLTRVLKPIKCDTFMPEMDPNMFKLVKDPNVDSTVQSEDGLEYKFEVYEKQMDVKPTPEQVKFNIVAAILDNRGIGIDGQLPWPQIQKDFDYYMTLTSKVKNEGKKCVNIKGRLTWESTSYLEKSRPNILNIVISRKSHSEMSNSDFVFKVVASLEEALNVISHPPLADQVETVWVMGGQKLYEVALNSPKCHRLYVTRIHADYACDRFFPKFDDHFHLVSDPAIESGLQEENGTQFQFEVYERN